MDADLARQGMGGSPLAGRHALVTGSSRGIGAAIASRLAVLGAAVTVVGRDQEGAARQADAIIALGGGPAQAVAIDVTEEAAVAAGVERAAVAFGAPDILVNNAGGAHSAPFARTTPEQWERMLTLNLTSVFLCTRAVLPGMVKKGWGRVISVASTAGLKGYGYVTAYVAAKHGVVGLTRALALETAKTGVTVNCVCPAYTDTDLIKSALDTIVAKTGRSREEALADLTAANPQGRLVDPAEVAEAVAFLALPASASLTGLALPVAGGEVM